MARVTVEDCVLKVPNKFELVLLASKRSRDIDHGAIPSLPRDNDKSTIIALREIAEESISIDGLRELTKKSLIEGNHYEEIQVNVSSDDDVDNDEDYEDEDENVDDEDEDDEDEINDEEDEKIEGEE